MTSTIDTSKYFYSREAHTEAAERVNRQASRMGVSVSRWVTNRGAGRNQKQTITYIVHAGERNTYATKQEHVMFSINDEQRGSVRDEMAMLAAVESYLDSIAEVTYTDDLGGDTHYGTAAELDAVATENDLHDEDGQPWTYNTRTIAFRDALNDLCGDVRISSGQMPYAVLPSAEPFFRALIVAVNA